jgi:hypothetical protein
MFQIAKLEMIFVSTLRNSIPQTYRTVKESVPEVLDFFRQLMTTLKVPAQATDMHLELDATVTASVEGNGFATR